MNGSDLSIQFSDVSHGFRSSIYCTVNWCLEDDVYNGIDGTLIEVFRVRYDFMAQGHLQETLSHQDMPALKEQNEQSI